jgi:uncharacterized protein (TIGR02996 family)
MSDRDAFLRAIRAHPDDDTPRLIFADWLDDRGDPLGELIRLQIELDPIREQIDSPRVRELLDREADLLGRHGPDWVGRMTDLDAAHPGFGPVFRRGLPELVCLSLDNFLSRGGELFEDCPTVREVSVYGVAGRGAELAACPHLTNVETLEIADWLVTDDETALAASDRIGRIGNLRLWSGASYLLADYRHGQLELITLEWLNRQPYPLMGDLGYGFVAGRLGDGWDVLFVPINPESCAIAFFNPNGSLDDINELRGPVEWHVTNRPEGFTCGLVRVQEFAEWGLAVRLWPRSYLRDYLRNPFERPTGWTNEAWTNRGGVLRRWLQQGRFVIEWDGREFWADSSGTIFSS